MNHGMAVCVRLSVLLAVFVSGCARSRQTSSVPAKPTLRDGVYEGSDKTLLGKAIVKVTIKDGKIVDIAVLERFCSWLGAKAYRELPSRIVEKQTPDVDAVTGATHSSSNIKNAVKEALRKAAVRVTDE